MAIGCQIWYICPFLQAVDAPGRILAAAWIGRTRLIDNMPVGPAAPDPAVRPV